jgi:poly-gamma-glutamate capsule biosynthesis protein CapA/YwtB (metallophosphatase superfamily)
VKKGTHAGKAPVPFWALIAVLVVVAGSVAIGARASDGDGDIGSDGPGVASGGRASSSPRPSPTQVADHPKRKIVIHGAGDVSLDPGYIQSFVTQGYGYAWSGLDGSFRRDDLTVVNVECPVTDRGTQLDKEFSFHGTPAALPAMRAAGVDVGSLANNHAYDRGPDGVVDSIRNLRSAGIAAVGAGKDQAQALRPVTFQIRGWNVAVLGFDEVLDPLDEVAGPDKPGTAAGHDFHLMVEAVKAASARADIVVVMIHWGVELDSQPRAYQIEEGHRLIDAGADVIFGAHSHRLQAMSTYHGRPIFWSLGNFVWPNLSTDGSTTAIAQVAVSANGRFTGRLLPVFITAPGHPELR